MDMEVGSTQSTGMDLNKNLSSAGLRNWLVKYFPRHIGFCDHRCFQAHPHSKLFVNKLDTPGLRIEKILRLSLKLNRTAPLSFPISEFCLIYPHLGIFGSVLLRNCEAPICAPMLSG